MTRQKDVVKQLENLVGVSVVDSNEEINLNELWLETDRTCKVVNQYMNDINEKAERWFNLLNECAEAIEILAHESGEWEMKLEEYNAMIGEVAGLMKQKQ